MRRKNMPLECFFYIKSDIRDFMKKKQLELPDIDILTILGLCNEIYLGNHKAFSIAPSKLIFVKRNDLGLRGKELTRASLPTISTPINFDTQSTRY